jgi:crotonobetaine/carnitine-CoA ligase
VTEHLQRLPFEDRAIHRLLELAAAERPDEPFLRWQGRQATAAEVDARANRVARGLRARGVRAGDRVAVMMQTTPAYVDLWFALGKLGAVEVPINTAYVGDLLRYQLHQARVGTAVVDGPSAERVAALRPQLPELGDLLVDADAGALPDGATGAYAELVADDDADLGEPVDPAALGCIIYTSGTTGPSKGVMLTHHHEATFGVLYAEIVRLGADDVVLNYLPFFHIAGKFLTTACLLTGAPMVLEPRLSVERFWDDARREGVTNFVAVGGVCNMLHGRPPREDDADNPVRTVYAVPAPAEIHASFERRFGVRLVEAYGSTETNLVLHTSLDQPRPGSCGRPHPSFDVRLVDEDDAEVGVGEAGEIVVRPRQAYLTMAGYDGMPEKTTEAWRNLWFHTGDRARRDADGWFWFLDRMKDSIRRRGENISSFEVERLVGAHPAVAEVAAVAVASELGEDEVKVVVVAREGGEVEPEELLRWCADRMPYFMVPRYIELAAELERTPTNKVEKYKLRAAGVTPQTWDCERAGWRVTRDGLRRLAPAAGRAPAGP